MTSKSIVLRNTRNRHLKASINAKGGLVIEGQDLGSEVEGIFGYGEYEWAWTINASDCDRLLAALGAKSDLQAALGERFSGTRAAGLQSFLESEGIEFEAWGRIGD
jgi:hypothetical protein